MWSSIQRAHANHLSRLAAKLVWFKQRRSQSCVLADEQFVTRGTHCVSRKLVLVSSDSILDVLRYCVEACHRYQGLLQKHTAT